MSKRTPEDQALWGRWREYKRDRRKKGWHLTREQAFSLYKGACHWCKLPSDPLCPHGIDRVKNSSSYELGNAVSCCSTCNKAKSTMTGDEFMAWLQRASSTVTKDQFVLDTAFHLAKQAGQVHTITNDLGTVEGFETPNVMDDGKTMMMGMEMKTPVVLTTEPVPNKGIWMTFDMVNGIQTGTIEPKKDDDKQ